jgi:hypothetical protein
MDDDTFSDEAPRRRTIRELGELVAALDRRVPQVHAAGEASIARAAAALRAVALSRIDELEQGEAAASPEPPTRASDAP